jgi:hypothetical protein
MDGAETFVDAQVTTNAPAIVRHKKTQRKQTNTIKNNKEQITFYKKPKTNKKEILRQTDRPHSATGHGHGRMHGMISSACQPACLSAFQVAARKTDRQINR